MFDSNSILSAVSSAAEAAAGSKGRYLDERDGFYHCSACGSPIQTEIILNGEPRTVWACCKCDIAERDAVEAGIKRRMAERRRLDCFGRSERYLRCTFDADDDPGSMRSRIARAYAEKFSLSSDWLLLFGGSGVGKSFLAAAICNAVFDRGFSFRFLTVSGLSRELWNADNKAAYFRSLDRYDLLVIDDLGEARGTQYMTEITFDLLDGRLNSDKPCIITTNKTLDEMREERSPDLRRIYSRLCERSMPLKITGEDRRKEKMLSTANERINELLSGSGT